MVLVSAVAPSACTKALKSHASGLNGLEINLCFANAEQSNWFTLILTLGQPILSDFLFSGQSKQKYLLLMCMESMQLTHLLPT